MSVVLPPIFETELFGASEPTADPSYSLIHKNHFRLQHYLVNEKM